MPSCFSSVIPWVRAGTKRSGPLVTKGSPHTQDGPDDPPPVYAREAISVRVDEAILKTIEAEIETQNEGLRDLSWDLHDHPELGWEERHAHEVLTKFLGARGWTVTRHYLNFETAWRAEWSFGTGGPVVGVNSEMDALPGIGHACGHNLIAIVGVGVALGLKAAMSTHKIPGKIILLGTPAEEGGAGKVGLLDKGAYAEMDVCIMAHPSVGAPHTAAVPQTLAVQSVNVEFHGHTAHAGAQPWEGQNALDAAVLTYNAVSVLRQQIKPTHRIHGIIEGRDWAPNIIPDYAKMRWLVRAPTSDEVEVLGQRLVNCVNAAALATSCKVDVSSGVIMKDLRQNQLLAREFASALDRYGYETSIGPDVVKTASTDFGNITYALPGLHPMYGITTVPGAGNHTAGFTAEARTQRAHDASLDIVKGLAATGVRVLVDSAFLAKVKEEFSNVTGTACSHA